MKRAAPDLEKIAIERVRALRHERGMTQEQLAERADLTAEAVNRVERGVRIPTLKTLGKLAAGLGVSPAALVDVAGIAPPSTVGRHVARIVAQLEDQDEAVQRGAEDLVLAYLRTTRRLMDQLEGRRRRR
jgi:transcriptional regulator with XRE-family HTH domain